MRISIRSFWPAIAGLIVATILFCLPGAEFPKRDWFSKVYLDKWVHIGLFGALVTLWGLPFIHKIRERQRLHYTFRWVAGSLLLYGIIIELIQGNFIPYRTLGVDDMVADAVGCGIGLWFVTRQQKIQKRL